MGKPTGFLEYRREEVPYRDPLQRLADFDEVYGRPQIEQLRTQGARCMDCGVPFCQSFSGCPVDNLIPEWNDLVYHGRWKEAVERLHRTNNFPEITGRVCPAPCEGACVLGISQPQVTIKNIEKAIADRGFDEGWIRPLTPEQRTGRRVAVVGSGPAGLAAAEQLNHLGHEVTVYEREDRPGGLLMYGIPAMKLDKSIVMRRIELLKQSGVRLVTDTDVGRDTDARALMARYDAVLLATGATRPRDLDVPGRDLPGIHFAMDYLTHSTRRVLDPALEIAPQYDARDKDVVVIGGGDTGTDCVATALRQGCRSLVNLELLPQPPTDRGLDNPWPQWPLIQRTDYGHQEAIARFGEDPRRYAVLSKQFVADAHEQVAGVTTLDLQWSREDGKWKMDELEGSQRLWQADLVLLAMGFLGPEHYLAEALGVACDGRSNYAASSERYATSLPAVFAAGDCRRGQSLVVWAIHEGRAAAECIDRFLAQSSSSRAAAATASG